MRMIAFAAANLIACACLFVATAGAETTSEDAAYLRHLKEVLWPQAYREQDVALLDSILAEEFQLVDAEGTWSGKADELAYVRDNPPGYDSLVFTIRRLDIFKNGTAIVAGQGNVTGSDDDGPYLFTYQSTNVLIKRGGKWKAIASHVSGIQRQDTARDAAVRSPPQHGQPDLAR